VVAAFGHTDASYDQTHAAMSAGAQTSTTQARVLGLGDPLHRRPGDPAGLVVLDSTLTPAAVVIGGIWIG
jgi:N-acetylglucosamine-6-phosphate deacetylase